MRTIHRYLDRHNQQLDLWTFGDGGTSTEQNPRYRYTKPGTYTVSLTVTEPVGSDTKTVTDYILVTGKKA
ncbi:PKD domain-containing protein [Methanoculleus sp. 7T]|uniref:PKD domain-containing protein n=1 Tax=Methanoculleus sp. 7T TaxID=2937282 RepID=UPI0032BFAD48